MTLPSSPSPSLQQLAPRLHPAYCWAPDIRERIVQFSFQLCRTNDPSVHCLLASQLRTMLHSLSHALLNPCVDIQRQALHCLSVLYRLIGFTRDTQFGKGECDLTYLMICEWYAVHPPLACAALQSLVYTSGVSKHHNLPYGSWKDMKRFCLYAHRQYQYDAHHPLILYACALLNQQLRVDHSGTSCKPPSLVAKWIPREKSPAGKLMYNTLAATYFPWIPQTASTCGQQIAALAKCKLLYRQLLSEMNRRLRTVQVFQCAQQWKAIRFPRDLTAATLQKQHRSFLRGLENNEDRTACREHFLQFLAKVEKQTPILSGANPLSLLDLENEALRLLNNTNHLHTEKETQDHAVQVALLNHQWQHFVQQHPLPPEKRRYLIPLLDASASVLQQVAPRIPAIALALYVAEQSAFGKRVLCFSSTPQWIALDSLPFLEMFAKVHGQTKGCATHSNIHAATQLLCNTMHTASLTPEDVQDLTMVLLSDMQVELPEKEEKQLPGRNQLPLMEALRKQFRRNGWPMPRIWCWNVSSSAGFPARYHEGNVAMLSGWQPRGQLQYLCGAHGATQHHGVRCSPWTILQQQLNHPRYHLLQDLCAQAFYNLHLDIFEHGLVVH